MDAVDKYVQEDTPTMTTTTEHEHTLAALRAICGLLNHGSTTLKQNFDTTTREHVVTLECRFAERSKSADADQQREYVPLLRGLLSA